MYFNFHSKVNIIKHYWMFILFVEFQALPRAYYGNIFSRFVCKLIFKEAT